MIRWRFSLFEHRLFHSLSQPRPICLWFSANARSLSPAAYNWGIDRLQRIILLHLLSIAQTTRQMSRGSQPWTEKLRLNRLPDYNRCFDRCPSLMVVSFCSGSKLTCISDGAFHACVSLKSIIVPSSVETTGVRCFSLLIRELFALVGSHSAVVFD
jgi:hypothetical protein